MEEAARRWAVTWARGWREHDVDAIAGLYAEDATFRSAPERDVKRGRGGVRDYSEWAFADEASAECWFADPLVSGSRAAASWWTISTARDGASVTLIGVSRLRFDTEGLVVDQQDVWTQLEGPHEPYAGWAE